MTKFIFVRHGQSKANECGYLVGSTEAPLSELGKKQAKAVCQYLLKTYKIDAIYSSPLSRACDTVKGVAEALNLPIIKENDLIDINVGKWEGLSYDIIHRDYGEEYNAWATDTGVNSPTDGESVAHILERVMKKLKEIAKKEDGKTVLIGSHACVIRTLQCYAQNLPLELMKNVPWMVNTAVAEMNFDGEHFYICKFGFDGHLENLDK